MALAVVAAVRAVQPNPGPNVRVLVAAGPLPAGTVLAPAEVRLERLPRADEPSGALVSLPAGATLAGPLATGEPLTWTALSARGYLPAGTVEAAVQLATSAASSALATGELVELIGARPDGSAATILATGARIVALPAPGLVVLVIPANRALAVAAAAANDRLSVGVESLGCCRIRCGVGVTPGRARIPSAWPRRRR
ncbi:MAG: SAF domain-containing protein [Mycobacteriales bacterium]